MSVEQNMARRKRRFKRKHHMLQLSFLAVIAAVILVIWLFSNPLRGLTDKLGRGEYQEAVDLYNRKVAGHKRREKKVNGSFEKKIMEIRSDAEAGKIPSDRAEKDLAIFEKLENKELAGKASEGLARIKADRKNQALLEKIKSSYEAKDYLEVMKLAASLDPSSDQYKEAEQLYDSSRDQLLSTLDQPENKEDLGAQIKLLDSYLDQVDEPAFSSRKKELEAQYDKIQVSQKALEKAEQCMKKHDYKAAFKVLEDAIKDDPENTALTGKLQVYHKIYVINASKDVSLAVSRFEFTKAKKIIDYARSVYDSETLGKLPEAVDRQQQSMKETRNFKKDPELCMRFRNLATGWKEHSCSVKHQEDHSTLELDGDKVRIDKTTGDELIVLKPGINAVAAIANTDFIFDAKGVDFQLVDHDGEDYYMISLSDSVAALLPVKACKEYFSYQDYITDAAKGSARFGKTAKQ